MKNIQMKIIINDMSIINMFVSLLAFSILYFSNTFSLEIEIRELIEKIKKSPPEERYIYMNELKLRLRELKEEQREEIIRTLYRELAGRKEREHEDHKRRSPRRTEEEAHETPRMRQSEEEHIPTPNIVREEPEGDHEAMEIEMPSPFREVTEREEPEQEEKEFEREGMEFPTESEEHDFEERETEESSERDLEIREETPEPEREIQPPEREEEMEEIREDISDRDERMREKEEEKMEREEENEERHDD